MSVVRCSCCDTDIDTDYDTEIYPTTDYKDMYCFSCIDRYNLEDEIAPEYREDVTN